MWLPVIFSFISDDEQTGSLSIPSLMLWFLNIFIMAFCLVKMFVYGDPILPEKSKEMQKYWNHRNQADTLLRKVPNCKVNLRP